MERVIAVVLILELRPVLRQQSRRREVGIELRATRDAAPTVIVAASTVVGRS